MTTLSPNPNPNPTPTLTPARQQREPSIEHTPEYDHFIALLDAFYKQRGTSFDPAPKVGNRRVDLLRLYRRVTGAGGYDAVSDIRATRLAWRKIGQEFNLGTANLAALAFSLKTAYYRNLAAYEIVNFHHRIPPPKEIFEDVSAKGGNLLNRTTENYRRPMSRDELSANGLEGEGSDEERHTPGVEAMDVEEPGSIGRRALRQAPPQRVIFQPDTANVRQTRQYSGPAASPAPQPGNYSAANGLNNPNMVAAALDGYEPKQQFPLTLRPVITPGNNPDQFKASQKALRDAILAARSRDSPANAISLVGMMLPGSGYSGPNIYIRTLLSLQSGILEEQEYALHHLVKISFERGDKYRFEPFPGLATALLEKILEVGSLFASSAWHIVYRDDATEQDNTLDGLSGTEDLMAIIEATAIHSNDDKIEPGSFSAQLRLINEATLVLRNMSILESNAEYLSKLPAMRDTLIILLNLPKIPATVEIQQYGLEIAEQLTKFYLTTPEEALFTSLLAFTLSTDRAAILTALRAISRFSIHCHQTVKLQNIPIQIIERLCGWILVEDEDLRGACLDFLYHYTAVADNIDIMLESVNVEGLVKQLVRLLLYNARNDEQKPPPAKPSQNQPAKNTASQNEQDIQIPRIPNSLVEQLLGYDEPERSSRWLRACFEENVQGEITQIALWQAYQIPFAPYAAQRPLLPAKDFITNVSTTFASASAQVMNGPTPRFVIRGIEPRLIPVDAQGHEFMRCLWHLDDGSECGEFSQRPKDMWEHVVSAHLGLVKDGTGKYDFTSLDGRTYVCHWSGCTRFSSQPAAASSFAVGMHLKTHLPDSSERAYHRSKHNRSTQDEEMFDVTIGEVVVSSNALVAGTSSTPHARPTTWSTKNTAIDERADASGLPLTSALVLRNLIRNIPGTEAAGGDAEQGGEEEEALVWRILAPVKEQLFFVMAYNQSLREYLPALTKALEVGGVSDAMEK